mmetsp:Transcript_44799/g.122359  ORF Transcript_44799/g.122359 Transcript_44799/m.122359 type:complete len:209 (-) Transcript_44799:549-1175(-)
MSAPRPFRTVIILSWSVITPSFSNGAPLLCDAPRKAEVRHLFVRSRWRFGMDSEIGHELIPRVLVFRHTDAGGVEEEARGVHTRRVVDAVGAKHIEFVKAQARLHRSQGLHRAAHAAVEQPLDRRIFRNLVENGKAWAERGFDPAAALHLLRSAADPRHWLQRIRVRRARHHHRVHPTGGEELRSEGRCNASPLRTVDRGHSLGKDHV